MASMRSTATIMAAGLGIVACDKKPTPLAPDADSLRRIDPFGLSNISTQSSGPTDSPFGCAVSFQTARGPYRYAFRKIHFGIPPEDHAPDGSKLRYVLHVENAGEDPVASAYCLIPNTPKAIAFLDRNIAHGARTQNSRQSLEFASPPVSFSASTTQLATVWVIATPDYWYSMPAGWDDGSGWANTSHDSGGSFNYADYNPDLTPPPSCFPNTDSLCLAKLTAKDSATITNAVLNYVTPSWYISDTALRQRCADVEDMFQFVYAQTDPPAVYRGAYNTNVPGTSDYHFAEVEVQPGIGWAIHFDPWLLDSAATGSSKWLAELANSALHETLHTMGHDHAPGEQYNIGNRFGPQYTSDYYKDLNWYPQLGQSCILYP